MANRLPVKIVHIITGLDTGGAEMMLYKLMSAIDHSVIAQEVISLTDIGPIGERIQNDGIRVHAAGFTKGLATAGAFGRLVGLLRSIRPDAVQTWMYHADLIGGLAAKWAGVRAVAWNIQNSSLDPKTSNRSTILIKQACARLSRRLPSRIVCCSERAKDLHISNGYTAGKFLVIPNAFDLSAFRPDMTARADVREEFQLAADAPLVGLIGRYDPQKDHAGFIQAAALLAERIPEAHFILCGDRVVWDNSELTDQIDSTGIRSRFHLLGRRADIARLTASLDVAASSSAYGEAFSNVLGEAMACGVPCVSTDVGDAALIVGDTGLIVPPQSPLALAEAVQSILSMDVVQRVGLGTRARTRIQENFSLPRIAVRYQQLYQEMAPCAA